MLTKCRRAAACRDSSKCERGADRAAGENDRAEEARRASSPDLHGTQERNDFYLDFSKFVREQGCAALDLGGAGLRRLRGKRCRRRQEAICARSGELGSKGGRRAPRAPPPQPAEAPARRDHL